MPRRLGVRVVVVAASVAGRHDAAVSAAAPPHATVVATVVATSGALDADSAVPTAPAFDSACDSDNLPTSDVVAAGAGRLLRIHLGHVRRRRRRWRRRWWWCGSGVLR